MTTSLCSRGEVSLRKPGGGEDSRQPKTATENKREGGGGGVLDLSSSVLASCSASSRPPAACRCRPFTILACSHPFPQVSRGRKQQGSYPTPR
eukprot:71051-Rhodomonas_salina.1